MTSLILASRSPRRKELLESASIEFQIHVPEESELEAPKIRRRESPGSIVRKIAKAKAEACARELLAMGKKDALILAADTLVFLNNKVLGKPSSEHEAKAMLKMLSGNWHQVNTGVSVIHLKDGKLKSRTLDVKTKVKFFRLKTEWINWYVNTGEPMDKAGAYGAQGFGSALVEKFSGSYTNVVGLPLGETLELLELVSGIKRTDLQAK